MGAHSTAAAPLERLQTFFAEKIWAARRADLRRSQAALYRVSRIVYSAVQGCLENQLTIRAAALTYFSILSIVPFLAFAFAILKGFGAYASFIQGTVHPYLQETFGGNRTLLDSIEKVLQFVDRTNVSTLGVVGLLILVYTSVSLLASAEAALNVIWGARTRRSFLRQVTDYVTLLVTTPLLVLAAGTFATAAQSSHVVVFLRQAMGLGAVIDFMLQFTSLVVVGIAFFAIYTILPNVRIRPLSALIGALVGAVLWQGALVLYVKFQVGVSSYNALYSALSAVPIFLVWTYVSWLILLVGAQVAASHQNEQAVRQRFRARHADQDLKETLALIVAAHVARDFLSGAPRRSRAGLAELVAVSPLTVEEILDALVRAGILARTVRGAEMGYLPARDVDAIRVKDVQDALRRDAQSEEIRAEVERQAEPEFRRVLRAAEEERRASPQNLTLRQLASMIADPGDAARQMSAEMPAQAPAAPAPGPAAQGGRPVANAK